MSDLLNAALNAAARGWPVFPLRPGDKRPALHGETACPHTGECADGHAKWEQRATTDPDRIRRAWSAGAFNVGLATGPSGLLVVDLDQVKAKDVKGTPDGVTSFAALCERAGQPVPHTYRVRTAGGGQHLYFWVHQTIRVPSSKGRLAPKIDTRAWGGYVVAPGSTIDGTPYEITEAGPVAELPTWLMLQLQDPPRADRPPALAPVGNGARVSHVALERESAAVAAAVEGEREAVLFKAARSMGRFVAWGDIPRHVVEDAFQTAGESAGLKPYEVRSTLRSALNWSIRTARPRVSA
ncbi:bifunctional DNA primase/polymerase [Streptomyces sp. NPDC051561]|uniref:bifunctional DNA primase/polymerase n=1 Tax=Streptomyces sp. NPDC051561 TaxID=3365658 RepID=UPI0037BB6C2D